MQVDRSMLEMALVGYEAQVATIQTKMAEIRAQFGKTGKNGAGNRPAKAGGGMRRHRMSAAGRKRIAAAQRKRWAKFHAK